jgi:hypothetical protein
MILRVFFILLVVLGRSHVCAGEIVASSAASDDDCTIYNGAFSLTDYHSYFGSWNDVEQACGLRFCNITIPQEASIDSAWIVARAEYDTYDVSVRIYGNDTDSAASFSDSLDFDNRVRTTACVDWNLTGDFGSGFLRTDTLTGGADLAPVIQEIVNRPGWKSGNAIVLLFHNNGTTGDSRKRFRSYDRGVTYSDTLHVIYSQGTVPEQSLLRRRRIMEEQSW